MTSYKTLGLTLMTIMIFSMGIVNAGTEVNQLPTVKQNDCILLTQTCASCSFVNVSVTYKNTTILDNKLMSKSGALWTYSFCDTSNLGRHDVSGYGDLEGTNTGFDVLYFEVTQNGFLGTTGFYVLIFLLSFGIIVLGIYTQEPPIIILGSLGLYFIGLYILFNGIIGLRDMYTRGLGIITLGLAFYISAKAGMEFIGE